jgi:hypothetical protein
MQKHYFFKAFLLTVLLSGIGYLGNAQYYKPGSNIHVEPDPVEVTGGVDLSKLKSNDSNYNSKYKPPDWWLEGMRWGQSISELFHGFFSPGLNSSPAEPGYLSGLADPSGEYYERVPDSVDARKNYFFSYGIGLGIGMRGGKYDYPGGSATTSILYLQLPLLKVRYNYILNDGSILFADAGPYYGIALGGHYKDNIGKQKLKFGNSPGNDFRRADWGLKFQIGYKPKTQPFLISLTSDLGLRNITPGGDSQAKIKNQAFGLKLGYRIGFKKP